MIDIIVAINSINETVINCLNNVIACTDLNRHRLLLVAYGKNIENVVAGLSAFNSFHTVILRANNSYSAIAALEAGASFGDKNDVVLLDTDVIVTPDWIEKLSFNLSMRPETATVSPVVIEDIENEPLYKYAPSFSVTKSPSDSCVLIPRDVINLVGDIDAAGFFDRCTSTGLCHYQADNAIVYLNQKPIISNKSTILYVLGEDVSEAEKSYQDKWLFFKDFLPGMEKKHKVYVAVRRGEKLVISSRDDKYKYEFPLCIEMGVPVTYVSEYRKIWNSLLRYLNVDLLHILDVKGIGLDVIKIAKELDIPVLASVFDYGFICPNEKLLRPSGTSCYLAAPEDNCKACITRSCNIDVKGEYLKKYQKDNFEALCCCETIFVPSMSMKYYMSKAYPTIGHKFIVLTPGSDVDSNVLAKCVVDGKNKKSGEGIIRVGYFVTENAEGIYYHGGRRVESTLQKLFEVTELVDVTYVAIDAVNEEAASKIDVLLYLPNWPVAYGAVVSESIKYGIPIITIETGGVTERMQQYTHGFSVPSSDVIRGVRDILISVVEDKNLLPQKKILAGHSYIKSVGEMDEEYELCYESYDRKNRNYTYYEKIDDDLMREAISFAETKEPEKEKTLKKIIKHLLSEEV